MTNKADLPFLLTLLEDDSTVVQKEVQKALLNYGTSLERVIEPYKAQLSDLQNEILSFLCAQAFEEKYGQDWLGWLDMQNDKEALEHALVQLAYLDYSKDAYLISESLDELAAEYNAYSENKSASDLMEFLFQVKGFTSPHGETDLPIHNNLLYVIDNHRGSQIALSCLAILVGSRAGLDLHGINIQGNFIAISFGEQEMQMYNSFNQGKPLARASVIYIEEAFRRNQIAPYNIKATTHEIVLDILTAGIEESYRQEDEFEAERYKELHADLSDELNRRGLL
ncbi:MAG: transglutaminase family protein [Bacteroidota bacterium]